MTIKGETARLNNEIVGNFLGGRYGKNKGNQKQKNSNAVQPESNLYKKT
jgi:hypothetical protein